MTVPRFEVWSDWECNSGVMQDVLRDVVEAEEHEEIVGEKGKILFRDLNLTVPRDDAGYSALQERKIIRIVDTVVREYRIFKLTESHSGPKMGEIECLGPEYDLKYSKIVRRVEANGLAQPYHEAHDRPPTEHIDIILGAFSPFVSGAPSYFSRGTVQFTDNKDMIYDWDTPLSALEELSEIYGAEIQVIRNGAVDFEIEMLTQIGATGDEPLFTIGRNILSIEHESDSEEQANVVFVQGGGGAGERGNIAGNGFIATGVSGNDITFAESVVHEDDQWNNFYIREPDGSISAISDSVAPDTITVVGHSVAVGDVVTFVENSAGDDLIFVESPSSIAIYDETSKVLNRQDIPNVNNISWNGYFNNWTQGGFGPAPCFPSFLAPEGPLGASDCIARTFVGLAHTAEFDEVDGELLTPRGWLHRVSSTGAVNDATQLTNINSNLGLSLAASNFGSYEIIGQEARNVTTEGPAIDGVYFGNDLVVQADVAPGWASGGCQDAGIYGKWRGPSNYYQALVSFFSGSIKIQLFRYVNGTSTQIGATYDTTDTDCTTVYTLKLAIEDGSQQLYVDGTLRVSGTDTSFDGQSGYSGIYTESAPDVTTELGASFDNFKAARGKNEIVMTGLPVNWTIEACGLSPATADANGKAVLDLAGADLDCANVVVKDDVAAVQDTLTHSTIGTFAGDVYVWSCDDANPGVSPDLNRTGLGHLVAENFDVFQCPSLADSCWFRYPRGFPAFYPTMNINCISPFSGNVEFTNIAAGDVVGRGNSCWGRESLLVQSTISARTNIQAEPGVAVVLTSIPYSTGYIAYIDDATSGTLHLAKLTNRALASLGTDTTWTFTTDTDYVIQLHVENGVQEARLWQAGSIVATVSATNSDHQASATDKWLPIWTHRAGTATADTSRHAQLHSDTSRYITVTNMPSGSTAQLRDDADAVIASAAESSGTAQIDVLGASEPQGINWNGVVAETHLNNWRAVTILSGGNEVARFQGVIHPGDTFDVGS